MNLFLKTIRTYFLDFFLLEIPNFIQIITCLLVLGFFMPEKYIVSMSVVLSLFYIYLMAKVYHLRILPHLNPSWENIKVVIYIGFVNMMILVGVSFLLYKMTIRMVIENNISEIERRIILKQVTQEDLEVILK